MTLVKETALITGASSGIGLELAHLFACNGHDLVLVARNEENLRRLATELLTTHHVSVRIIAKDLARTTSPAEVARELQAASVPVSVLVNNAGFGSYGVFHHTDLSSDLQMMQVNMVALTELTKLFLKDMLERRRGRILNVASTAAFQPGPLMAVYYATKAYVLSFSEALANELSGTGVTVTALCPGPTRTGFEDRANLQQSRLFRSHLMDARAVAKAGYRACMKGKAIVVPGWRNKLLAFAIRFVPRSIVRAAVRKAQESVAD
jgi:short-subunit dehydrogenase